MECQRLRVELPEFRCIQMRNNLNATQRRSLKLFVSVRAEDMADQPPPCLSGNRGRHAGGV
jgi:hypothetical protein